MTEADATVVFDRVCLAFKGPDGHSFNAVDDVSLTFAAGTINCIIGSDGGGKSTILRLISGLIPLTIGPILAERQPIQRLAPQTCGVLGHAAEPEGRRVVL